MLRSTPFIFSSMLLTVIAAQAGAESLRILTWEEYFDPQLIERFEQQYNTTIDFIYYPFDDIRDKIMAETDGYGIDIILVDDIELSAYAHKGWLEPVNQSLVSNLKYHGTVWSDLVDQAGEFAVPYGWGTYGIAYRKDLVKKPPETWADIFNPADELSGFIQMPPEASELMIISAISMGKTVNDANQTELNEFAKHLLNQKKHVVAYKSLDTEDSLLSQGLAKIAVSYNSDVVFLQDYTDNIEFVSPKDGTVMWIDFLTISANSHNKELAHQFLNFFLEPKNVTQNIEYHYTASFSDTAIQMLPEEIRSNRAIFPAAADAIELVAPPTKQMIKTQMRVFNALELD